MVRRSNPIKPGWKPWCEEEGQVTVAKARTSDDELSVGLVTNSRDIERMRQRWLRRGMSVESFHGDDVRPAANVHPERLFDTRGDGK